MTLDHFDKQNKKILEKKHHIPKIYKRNTDGLKKRNEISCLNWQEKKRELEEKRNEYNKVKKIIRGEK